MSDCLKTPELLRLGPRITILPVIHGSGQFALSVRRWMLETKCDVLAVPLPESFRNNVEQGVLELPRPSLVLQQPTIDLLGLRDAESAWTEDEDSSDDDDPISHFEEHQQDLDFVEETPASYVPIDPCQPVIMAIRAALGEHIPRAYIDMETDPFVPFATVMPDPFAVRHVSLDRFAAAVLPSIPPPPDSRIRERMVYMAAQLIRLEQRYEHIVLVASVLDWPWIREAYNEFYRNFASSDGTIPAPVAAQLPVPESDETSATIRYQINPRTLLFFLGELPFITGIYERARDELLDDDDLQIDGVKELLLAARDSYRAELGNRARRITPLLLRKCLQYIRNLSLVQRRFTPDLLTIVTAAKQVLGDPFALQVAEQARRYIELDDQRPLETITMGIDHGRLESMETFSMVSRLPGPPIVWHPLNLKRPPTELEQQRWEYQWNPYGQCSYPPEDKRIELFRSRVFDRARALVGNDLAKTEKFTTSVKDGIDIRDTLRHWYEKQIYVKVVPPSRGTLDTCVMLFDSPADPRNYPWRTTWFAEHQSESTLAFYATSFQSEMVGPGIGLSIYGGALFIFPPIVISDIWSDARLDFTETLEERLIAAACLYSRAREIALLSSLPPGSGWRRLARRFKKHLIHVPLHSFGDEQVQQLRMVHVLNGRHVRSYATSFIRKA
jgi:hypothetical protein